MAKIKYSGPVNSRLRQYLPVAANDEVAHKRPARITWHCRCGGNLFELREDGPYCDKCDRRADGWMQG